MSSHLNCNFFLFLCLSGQLVATVEATDKDIGENAIISYKITSGESNKFTIDSKTGVITTSEKLDREVASSYRLVITAKDQGKPSLSSTTTVSVTVLDENDNSPEFSKPFYQASVLENTALTTNVLHVMATDLDDGSNGLVTFSVLSGNTNDAFNIDNSTGFLSVNQNLDREAVAFYSLYISASDNAPNPKRNFVRVNFTVLDKNDNSPVFVNVENFTVVENVPIGANVGLVSATDADAGSNGEIRFSIVKGNDDNAFRIDPVSGQVKVNGKIDREKTDRYTLTVMASDQGKTSMKTTQNFYVTVEDQNDNPPKFDANVFEGL